MDVYRKAGKGAWIIFRPSEEQTVISFNKQQIDMVSGAERGGGKAALPSGRVRACISMDSCRTGAELDHHGGAGNEPTGRHPRAG